MPAPKLLLTRKSCHSIISTKDKKHHIHPVFLSSIFTILFYLFIFSIIQSLSHYYVTTNTHFLHPIFLHDTIRHYIVRNISFNFLSCLYCSILGWKNYYILHDVFTNTATPQNAPKRLLHYSPTSYPLILFFISYQLRNFYNDFYYNFDLIILYHHILCIINSSLCLLYTLGQPYCILACGISETSTVLLIVIECLDFIENNGLGQPLPQTHLFVKCLFVIVYLWIRIGMLTRGSLYFLHDVTFVWKKVALKTRFVLGFMGLLMGCVMVLQYGWVWIILVNIKDFYKKV